ncbi:MAG TPA: MFS transporter [Stellaceae bacterium]|jgi:AAHS family 4-hydroxybenzoate transporter-like MFS transporter
MAQGQTVNVSQVIDSGRFGGFQWMVAVWCFVLVTLDGFDNGAIGFVAPVIVKDWGLSMPAFTSVFAAGLFGLMIGALASGPIADRFGRKVVVLTSTLTFAIFALATMLAHSVDQLWILRFLTGIGVGGLMPNSIALTAEYAPKRIRATVVAIMFLGFPLGAGGGGFLGAALIPSFGWQSLFILGGLVPLILLPIAIFSLPESIRFLVTRGDRPNSVAALLNRFTGTHDFDGSESFSMVEDRKLPGFAVKHLLNEGRALNTSLLWITFFSNLLIIYYLNSWLPLVLRGSGVPLADSLRLGGLVSWGGIASTLILGPVVDRLGAPRVVTVLYVLAAAFIFAIGLSGADVTMLAITITGCGMCVIGGQSFINVMSAILYPTAVRSTGVGWALGVGRVGAIVGPVIGGILLAENFTPRNLFFMIAVPALVAALAMFILTRRLRGHETMSSAEPVIAH